MFNIHVLYSNFFLFLMKLKNKYIVTIYIYVVR